ncbi:ESPR-type extended signal peptide-containing protein [Snodgrassella gandavensis]|uniref:ESPR-type extended signal peptide-containing protein n=1 Tax=Snodgrassella gandavensis TaxID=2946698 RepID=UPI001EF48C43|nr:ESPR-type extended signal peptide-containing protein [Snodgrassella gandavensis]
MNKIYRAIWNETTQTWVAASELAKSRTKSDTVSSLPAAASVSSKSKLGALFKLGLIASFLNMSLLSSHVYAANAALIGGSNMGDDSPHQNHYKDQQGNLLASHGSIILNGANDFAGTTKTCGADEVQGRGVTGRTITGTEITALDEYLRFAKNQAFDGKNPYGTTSNATNANNAAMQGENTGGAESKMPVAYGVYSFASGCGSFTTGNYSMAFGTNATALAGGAMAIGTAALASGRASIAFGVGAEATGISSVALGSVASSNGVGSVAAGLLSQAKADGTVALGVQAQALQHSAVAIGNAAQATGEQSISIGSANQVSGKASGAIGGSTGTTSYDKNDGTQKTAATGVTTVTGDGSYSFGNQNGIIAANDTGVFGNYNTIEIDSTGTDKADNIRILGNRNTVSAKASGAMIVGNRANVSAANGLALGNNTEVSASNGVALGEGAKVSVDGGVALGSGSVASTGSGLAGYNPDASAETAATPVWKSTANAVAIGDAVNGHTRQITGLAAGTQDTDAVNVAQLKSLSNATLNSIASLSTSAESSLGTVNERLTELSNSASSSILSTSNKLNSLSTSVDTHINDTQIALDELQRSTSTSIQHLQEDALQWNAGEKAYDAAHLASGVKTTAKIINVAAGNIDSETSTDAVNGGQLYTTNVNLSTLDTKVSDGLQTLREQMNNLNLNIADIGSLSTVASNISSDVASLQSNALLWKNGAYDASHNDAPQKITNVEAGSIAQGSTDAINGGQLYSLSTATVTNLAEITAKLDDNDNKITEVKNQALLWNQSLNNGEGAYDARDRKITGVASGTLDATSSDVVIGAQLHETNTAVSTLSTSTSTGLQSLSTALQDSSTSIINSLSSLVDGSNGDIAALQKTALQWSSADQAYSAKYENENQRITNVLEAELALNSTDVATGNQLYTLTTATQERLNSLSSSLNGISADGVKSLSTSLSTANSNITTLQQDALQWNGQAYDASHGVTDGRGKITNVADADLLSTSSDVVTGGQLFTTNSNLSSLSSTVNTELNNLSQSTSTSINSLSTALNDFADNAVGSLSTVFDNKLATTHSSLSSLQQNALLWNADLGAYDATHNGQAQRITNVQAGDATAGSSDVVTGGQLYTTNSQLSYLSGSVSTTLNSLSSSLQNISDTSLAGLTNELSDTNRKLADLSLSTSMSFISTNANIESLQQNALLWNEDLNNGSGAYDAGHGSSSAQLITHVRAGAVAEDSTDAINGSQLFSLSSSTSTGLSSLSSSLQTFTDAQMGDLGRVTNKLNTVESNVVALQGNALQWNSNSGTEGAFDATRGGKSQQLTGIANGAISETSTDAINGMQMHSLSTATSSSLSSLSSNLNDSLGSTNQNLTALQQNAMQWNNSLKAYDASHNINGEVVAQRITNVAAGQEATDAVNFSQFSTLSSSTSSSVNSLSTAVSTAMTAEIGNITNITNSLSSGYSDLSKSLSTTNDSLNNLMSDTNTRIESLSTGYVEMHNNVAKLQEDSQNNLRWNSEYNEGEGAFDASKPGRLTRASEPGKIINVADGDISEHSHDAVTGGQLFTVKSDLASLSTATSSSLSSINNVLQIGGISSSISSLQVNALQWDNSLHAYNASYNGDPQRITNVKAGQETTDAVNFGQLSSVQNDLANLSTRVDNLPTGGGISQDALNSLSTALSNQISSITSGLGASYNPSTGDVGLHEYEIIKPDGSKETVTNVADVLKDMQTRGSRYAQVNSSEGAGSLAKGDNSIAVGRAAIASDLSAIAIGESASAGAFYGIALGKKASAKGQEGIALGSNAQAIADQGIALGAGSIAKRKGGEKQVYVPGTATEEQAKAIRDTISGAGAVSVGNEDEKIYRQITGVAAGSANTDAVNVAQLKGVNNKIDNINKYVNRVNERLQRTERRAYSGTALAMALSGAYLPSLNAGEQAVGVGVGTYRGYTAVGANYKAISNSGNIGWGAGVSTTGKEVGFNGGVGFKWSSN